jgi:peptidoglycan/xylan/chitin deacetylase (PgdA/CDA1 family)
MSRIAFTIDLDDWYHTPQITGSNFSVFKNIEEFYRKWEGDFDFLSNSLERLLELLDVRGIKATIFIIASIIDHYPRVVNLLKNCHHEIACHSLFHTVPFHSRTKELTQNLEEWESELLIAKKKIETTFGVKVIGYRAPGAYFADWMIPILIRNGFKYDSSISFNSIYNKTNVNLKNIPSAPYWLNEKTLGDELPAAQLLEIPWGNFKIGKGILPGGGAFFFRLLGFNYFKWLLNQNLKSGDTSFYIHAIDISPEKFPLHNFKKRPLYWINKGRKTQKKLSKLLDYFKNQFTTCSDIYENFQ